MEQSLWPTLADAVSPPAGVGRPGAAREADETASGTVYLTTAEAGGSVISGPDSSW